jgi:NDP-hexose C3-ketoreductase / dTDP-4-oxo-2-deoxy-alpha-D-pentos-2-ene 2,3-reductase
VAPREDVAYSAARSSEPAGNRHSKSTRGKVDAMEYTNLGRTGLSVSRLCLGTMNFGPVTSEPDSHAIMDRALDPGINFFDTANVYGWKIGEGITEHIIGRWLAQGDGRREKVVLATKVYGRMGRWPNEQGLSARHIVRACDESLRRLKTDWIDLYQMHHVSRTTPWEEIWQAMEVLVAQGKVLYIGSSNFAGWHLAQAQESASRRHFFGLVSEQCIYNLMTRHVELEVVPAVQHYGLGLIPWSPLHGGLLSGAIRKMAEGGAGRSKEGRSADQLAEHRTTIEAYEKLCADLGHDPADVALAWLLSRPGVTAPITGPRTIEQLDGSLRALEVTLDEATLNRLDELFPPVGKGGPGPEAWAW